MNVRPRVEELIRTVARGRQVEAVSQFSVGRVCVRVGRA
jgi:hypothetical protein